MTLDDFIIKGKNRGYSSEEVKEAIKKFRADGNFFDGEQPVDNISQQDFTVPDPKTTAAEELYGFNNAYVQIKTNTKISPEQHQTMMEAYSGVDGVTEPQMTGMIQEAQDVEGEPIDIIDEMNKFLKRDKYQVRGQGPGEITAGKTGLDKLYQNFYTGYRNRLDIVAQTIEGLLEDGAAYPIFRYVDFFPSRYRGLKQTVGLEDFDIPLLDDIADISGRVTEEQEQEFNKFKNYLKEKGYIKEAATLSTLDSITETLTFFRRIQQLGLMKGGTAVQGTGLFQTKKFAAKRIVNILKSGQKISLFAAMTAEDVTWKDRRDIYLITSLYTSTPAISGAIKNPIGAKGADFILNSGISALKKDGYEDIINSDMDNFDKIMAAGNLIGHDIVFSALTKSYRGEIAQYKLASAEIDAMARRNYNPNIVNVKEAPRPTTPELRPLSDKELVELEVQGGGIRGGGKGYFVLDKFENANKNTIDKTETLLKNDLARIEAEAKKEVEGPKAQVSKDETPKTEIPKDEVISEKPLENKQIEKAVKQTYLQNIKEVKENIKNPIDQRQELERRSEQLFEVLDAPKGTKVKTVINRINNVRQKKPVVQFKQKEYYKLLEQVSAEASRKSVGDVATSFRLMSEFAEANLPYREADKVKVRMQKLMESEVTPQQFVDRATKILDRATGRLKSIEQVVGIKDMSKRVDMTEAEMLRVVLKESQKAATGATKSISDKIVASQKEAQDIINSMPKETRSKVITSMRKIAKAKTDQTREKYLSQFNEQVVKIVDQYNIKEAKFDLNVAVAEAKNLIKSRKVRPDIAKNINEIVKAVDSVKFIKEQTKLKDKAVTKEEKQIYTDIIGTTLASSAVKDFNLPNKRISDMTVAELRLTTDTLNGYVHRMKEITNDIKLYSKSKAEQEVLNQKQILKPIGTIDLYSDKGKVKDVVKSFKTGGELIPRGIAESLDFYNPKGEFTKYQTRLEQSEIKNYEVILSIKDIMLPVTSRMSKLKFSKNSNKKEFDVKDVNGNNIKIKLGVADRSRIYLGYRDPETWTEGTRVGWKQGEGKQLFFIDDAAYFKIEDYMRQNNETKISDAMVAVYKILGGFADKTSMELNGYPLSIPTYTGARLRSGKNLSSDLQIKDIDLDNARGFNEQFQQMFVESSGRFKARTSSNDPLLVYNPEKILRQTQNVVATYYSKGDVLRDLNNFIRQLDAANSYQRGVNFTDQYARTGRSVEYEAYKKFVKSLNESGSFPETTPGKVYYEKLVNSAMTYLGGRALKINPKVAIMQLGSLSTASTAMERKYSKIMEQAFLTKKHASIQEMSERSFYLRARYDGRTGHIYSKEAISKKDERGFEMIKNMDARVIGSIYRAMERKVENQMKPNTTLSFKEFNKEVEKLVVDVIMKTQPSFEAVSRPALAQVKDPMLRMAFAFSSQRNKNYYLSYKAGFNLQKKHEAGILTLKDVQDTGKILGALLLNNLIITTINTTAQELIEEKFRQQAEAGGRLLPEEGDGIYKDLPWQERFVSNFTTVNLGNLGASFSMIGTILNGFDATATPFDAAFRDGKKIKNMFDDVEEVRILLEAGEYEAYNIWWRKNGMDFAGNTSEFLNLAVQPLTGVNIANAYKWGAEAPIVLAKKLTEDEETKQRREDLIEERDDKKLSEEEEKEEKLIKLLKSLDKWDLNN